MWQLYICTRLTAISFVITTRLVLILGKMLDIVVNSSLDFWGLNWWDFVLTDLFLRNTSSSLTSTWLIQVSKRLTKIVCEMCYIYESCRWYKLAIMHYNLYPESDFRRFIFQINPFFKVSLLYICSFQSPILFPSFCFFGIISCICN